MANKRKTGGLSYSKAITYGMPAGRGRKGERQSRSRHGKQTTSMVVPRNPSPSAPSIGTNECENYLDAAQLHELFFASCQPGVATHQAQLSKLYPAVSNPPGRDGRVHVDLSTYHSLEEGQREILKAFGLIVNIV